MRVHLRFLKKDPDLCKWRHSVGGKMLSFYMNSILSAELHNRIAFIPQTVLLSMDESSCDISFHTSSREIEAFVVSIPSNQRNKVIKEIIRKHLRSQGVIKSRTVNPFSEEVQMAPDKPIPKRTKVEFVSEKAEHVGFAPAATARTDKTEQKWDSAGEETDEERELRMALIAMAGE